MLNDLRNSIRQFIGITPNMELVPFEILESVERGSYRQDRIIYRGSEGDTIPAYLLLPHRKTGSAVLIHHQHNSERHLGKSEVVGLVGNPLQAFGAALAERGVVVLAPDSICFEDRRRSKTGTEAAPEADAAQHFNEMSYRLLSGDTLMRKVLDDATRGLSLLAAVDGIESQHVGVMGHSYGGNTALFQAAIDERVRFACSSGAVCSYKRKIADQTGIEMALILPGVLEKFDLDSVISAVAPRDLLVVSADGDKYSKDADLMVESAMPSFQQMGASAALQHRRYSGGHSVTEERFNDIISWVARH